MTKIPKRSPFSLQNENNLIYLKTEVDRACKVLTCCTKHGICTNNLIIVVVKAYKLCQSVDGFILKLSVPIICCGKFSLYKKIWPSEEVQAYYTMVH